MKWNKTIGDRVSRGGLLVARSQQHRQFGDPLVFIAVSRRPLIEQPSPLPDRQSDTRPMFD
jgi:hypothetical protein